MTDATDKENCADEPDQQVATTEKYTAANELLQQVDGNIVKTAALRRQMPAKCAQLLARRCRFQLMSAQKQSVKCAESSAAATAAAAAASFESQVNDEILQSLQSSMSDLHKLSATSQHLRKARQILQSNERTLSLIRDAEAKGSITLATNGGQ